MNGMPENTVLRREFVQELIVPRDGYRPFGEDEALSNYLYAPMRATGNADRMLVFIDEVEGYIHPDIYSDELNNEKLHRTMALLADMPKELSIEERLRAWEYFLDKNWVHSHRGVFDLERVIEAIENQDTHLGAALKTKVDEITERKLAELAEQVPADIVFAYTSDEFDVTRAMDAESILVDRYPEAVELSSALIHLLLTQRTLRR